MESDFNVASAVDKVIVPPAFKQVSEREIRLLRALAHALPVDMSPVNLTPLMHHGIVSSASVALHRIGAGIPVPATDFLAIAMVHNGGNSRIALILEVETAKRLVDCSLSRAHENSVLTLNSFERGVVLQIAALVAEELAPHSFVDIEVRGILDSEAQLRLFFATDSPTRCEPWYISGAMTFNDTRGRCLLVGNGSMNLCKENSQTTRGGGDAPSFVARLPVALHIVAGRTHLAASSLNALSAGDVITVDALTWPVPLPAALSAALPFQKNEIQLYSGYVATTATWIDQESIRIDESLTMNKPTENTHTVPVDAIGEAGDFEVPCQVEIDNLHITVADAARLVPGQVLRLNRPLDETVVLKAGDRRLCRGQLVQVGDELAIEVTEVP